MDGDGADEDEDEDNVEEDDNEAAANTVGEVEAAADDDDDDDDDPNFSSHDHSRKHGRGTSDGCISSSKLWAATWQVCVEFVVESTAEFLCRRFLMLIRNGTSLTLFSDDPLSFRYSVTA